VDELLEQLVHRREPPLGIAIEPAHERSIGTSRHIAALARCVDAPLEHRVDELHHRRRRERSAPVDGLEQRDAVAELIGARVHLRGSMLLGCHVRRRPEHGARLRHARAQLRARRRRVLLGRIVIGMVPTHREPEVEHHDALGRLRLAHHHVVRLEVAVDEPGGVRRSEAPPDVEECSSDLRPAALRLLEPARERDAVDELHRDVDLALERADLVHRDDVGMRHLGHRLRLANEPRLHLARAIAVRVGAQQLERHLAIELWIVRRIDDAHAAAAEPAQQHEAIDPHEILRRPEQPRLRARARFQDLGRAQRGREHGMHRREHSARIDRALERGIAVGVHGVGFGFAARKVSVCCDPSTRRTSTSRVSPTRR
jgi:hypothetical protein